MDTPNTPAPAVEARALTKKVKDGRERRTVLDALDLSVPRGELLFLRGPSGSGKTTLLALLGAMLSPTSGEVLLNGEPTSRLRDRHRAEVRRRAVGFVFQDVQLIDGMNALENVLVARVPDGIGPADRLRARTLLERFGVGALGGSSVRALSGGERQRVALARALLNDPPLLLLDEPTAHLDDARVDDVTALLAALAEEKRALVVATHDERLPSAFLAKGATYARSVTLASGRLSQGAVSARSTGSPAGSGATPDDAAP